MFPFAANAGVSSFQFFQLGVRDARESRTNLTERECEFWVGARARETDSLRKKRVSRLSRARERSLSSVFWKRLWVRVRLEAAHGLEVVRVHVEACIFTFNSRARSPRSR